MASGPQQLKEDFIQIQKLLEIYPDIKIINTEGDPPEQYDIEYTIKGYRTNPEGAPTPDNNHEVRITLPFGYPHFPPTVKPITPIFHPDIDPDAIRIADFWQENHSLADLIVHIGQMICGNHYTKDEPFNQNAFEWFEERSSWLPFDILEPRDEDDIEEIETDTSPSDTEVQHSFAPATDLDILKDDIDFPFDDDDDDFGGLEDEISFDLEDEESVETFDFQENEDTETEDIFSLETEDIEDNISFDLTNELDNLEAADESSLPDGLFDLETESTDEESTLEFDSEDIASAFGEEVETSATILDDLAGLDEEEDAFDFGLADESIDIDGGTTADLSGLEEYAPEENNDEIEFDIDESNEDEEKILSALSLNEEFTSADKLEGKSQAIRSLLEQKQIFSAKKILTEFSDSDALPEQNEFEQTIADAISEAENLYKKADAHEQKREFEKAGILLDLVANIATDFPGLDFARNRIRDSMMADGKKKPDADHDEDSGKSRDEDADASAKTLDKKKKSLAKSSFKIPARLIVILLGVIILCGIGAGAAYIYNNDSENIQLAQASFQKADQLVNSKEFKNAQKELNTARTALEKILFFQRAEKEATLLKITGLANSSLFKEGLKGRVLYGDQYYSVETAKAIDKFNTQKRYAEQVLKSKKIDQAILAYEKSLPYAQKAGFEEQVKEINRIIAELRLETVLTQAKQYEEEQNWLDAEKKYREAQELSKNVSTPEVQSDLDIRRATSYYRYNLQEGVKATNDSQWQTSIDAFQKTQKVLEEYPQIIPETNKTEIDKLLVQSQLFYKLAQAKKAYENKEWQPAIDTYNAAIILMQTNSSLLGEEATGNIEKISKTILTTQVAKEQAKVGAATAANELDKAARHYETIVTLIEKSTFKDDEILNKILEDARTKTAEIKKQLLISKKENGSWIIMMKYFAAITLPQSNLNSPNHRCASLNEKIILCSST